MAIQGHVFIDAGIVQSLSFAVAQQAAAFAAHVAACAATPARYATPIVCPCGTWHWPAPSLAPRSSAWRPPSPPAFGQAPSAAAPSESAGQEFMTRDVDGGVAATPPASESVETTGSETRPPSASVCVSAAQRRTGPSEHAQPADGKLAFPARFQADRGVPTFNRFTPLAELEGQEADDVEPPSCAFEGAAMGSGEAEVFLGGGAKLGTAATSRSRHASSAPRPLPPPVAPTPRSPSYLQKGGYATRSDATGTADGDLLVDWSGPRLPKAHASGEARQARPADAVTSNFAIGATAATTYTPRAAAADVVPVSADSDGSGQSRSLVRASDRDIAAAAATAPSPVCDFADVPGSGEIGRAVQPRSLVLASDGGRQEATGPTAEAQLAAAPAHTVAFNEAIGFGTSPALHAAAATGPGSVQVPSCGASAPAAIHSEADHLGRLGEPFLTRLFINGHELYVDSSQREVLAAIAFLQSRTA